MRNYKNLGAWKNADELTLEIYRITQHFPSNEIYGLTSQVRRSAYSVPANIAEAAGRESNTEYIRFLCMARGSLAETEYFLHLANKLDYLSESEYKQLTKMVNYTFSALSGLIKSIHESMEE